MRIIYPLFYASCRLLACLPMRALYVLSDALFLLVFYIVRYRKRVVIENLRNAFPEKTDHERYIIMRKFYHFFCDLIVEIIKMVNASPEEMHRRIRYSKPDIFNEICRKGKQAFCVCGHYGNWEWMASLEGTVGYHVASLYHPLENSYFDRFFYRLRSRFGAELIPSSAVLRTINKLTPQRPTSLFFIADQAPMVHETSYWTTFLNQDSAIFMGVERLARRYDTAVFFHTMRRIRRGYYEIDVTLITENAAETPDKYITDRHVALLEQSIRQNPQYWLWTHRRWKRKRPPTAEHTPSAS